MSIQDHSESKAKGGNANLRVALACTAFFCAMIGVAFASVPLYKLFCQVTGFAGTTQIAEQSGTEILERKIKVRFDANVSNGLPWDFKPLTREVELQIGEVGQVSYQAKNVFSVPTYGRASFNVTPLSAGAYFNKLQCFCFTDQKLNPGETLDMPVVFFVDPAIIEEHELDGLTTITLSYTFFPIDQPETPLAAARDSVNETEPNKKL